MVWVLRLTGFAWLCEKVKEHQTLPVECLPHPSPESIKADAYHDEYPHFVVVANSVPLRFPKAGVSSERLLNGCSHHQLMMPDMSCQ